GHARRVSPGPNMFVTAASRLPVPDEPSSNTSPFVVKIDRIRCAMLCSSRAYSGPRWLIGGLAIAASAGSETATGPGMHNRLFCIWPGFTEGSRCRCSEETIADSNAGSLPRGGNGALGLGLGDG